MHIFNAVIKKEFSTLKNSESQHQDTVLKTLFLILILVDKIKTAHAMLLHNSSAFLQSWSRSNIKGT